MQEMWFQFIFTSPWRDVESELWYQGISLENANQKAILLKDQTKESQLDRTTAFKD